MFGKHDKQNIILGHSLESKHKPQISQLNKEDYIIY